MIWLIRRLRRDFAYWDRYTRAAFVIGVAFMGNDVWIGDDAIVEGAVLANGARVKRGAAAP